MLYKIVHPKITRLVFWKAISPEHALKQFHQDLNNPTEYVGVKAEELTIADIERDLNAQHDEWLQSYDEGFERCDEKPPKDEQFGQIEHNPSF